VQVPDDAVQITDGTLTIHLKDVPIMDQFFFPGGPGTVPAKVSFDVTYTKTGSPRRVRPTSNDPLTPFTWMGEMSRATNSGTFSMAYNGGGFSVEGNFASDATHPDTSGFGQMGTESNGSFVEREDTENGAEANTAEDQAQQAQINAGATASVEMSAGEKFAIAWRSSRARALRAWKSKP
jgi:hypothetical protein